MTTNITPRVGETVLYTLSEMDAKQIIQNRRDAGISTARGNDPHEGDTYPAIIVRDFGQSEEQYRSGVARAKQGHTDQWRKAHGLETENDVPGFWTALRDMDEQAFALWLERWEADLAPYDPDSGGCNLQVFLDGNDVYWATSRSASKPGDDPKGHFQYR